MFKCTCYCKKNVSVDFHAMIMCCVRFYRLGQCIKFLVSEKFDLVEPRIAYHIGCTCTILFSHVLIISPTNIKPDQFNICALDAELWQPVQGAVVGQGKMLWIHRGKMTTIGLK